MDTSAGQALLRQLAAAFATARLYPGQDGLPVFTDAVARVATAAEPVLAGGVFDVEIRNGRFVLAGRPVDDPSLDNLARACFARRVEHVRIVRTPSAAELMALYEILVLPPDRIESGGGLHDLLARAGITSLSVAAGTPETTTGEETPDDELTVAGNEPDGAEEDPLLDLEPVADAAVLYNALERAAEAMPPRARRRFYRRATQLVRGLPYDEQARFARLVLDRHEDESFAERYLGHLPDLDLSQLVVAVAESEGGDRVALARRVAEQADRHDTLVQLVAGARSPSTDPEPLRSRDVGDGDHVADANMDHLLRTAFPSGPGAGRHVALRALRDYVVLADRAQQVEEVLDAAVDELRRALREGDDRAVLELLDTLEDAGSAAAPERRRALTRPREEALTSTLVRELAETARLPHDLLAPFGAVAVDVLVAALGLRGSPRGTQALGDALAEVGHGQRDHLEEVIAQQPPGVAAELVRVLGRLGGPSPTALTELAQLPAPEVARAVLTVLPRQPVALAAQLAAEIARRSGDTDLQAQCLEALAALPGRAGVEPLRGLARRRRGSRLPLRLRRRARALARQEGDRR